MLFISRGWKTGGAGHAAEEVMPIYEYECRACGNIFERVMKVGEPEPSCMVCGQETRKLVAAFRTNAWSTFLDRMEKRVSPEKFK
jgi:putative FmdB family regulatory protein